MKFASLKPVAPSFDAAVRFRNTSAAQASRTNEFLDRLAELPLTTWLATGRALHDKAVAHVVRQSARDALELAIGSHRLGFAAWSVRDGIETLVFFKTREMCEWTPVAYRHFASAHGAAETAALAVLARDHLTAEQFQTLVTPFAQCINSCTPPGDTALA